MVKTTITGINIVIISIYFMSSQLMFDDGIKLCKFLYYNLQGISKWSGGLRKILFVTVSGNFQPYFLILCYADNIFRIFILQGYQVKTTAKYLISQHTRQNPEVCEPVFLVLRRSFVAPKAMQLNLSQIVVLQPMCEQILSILSIYVQILLVNHKNQVKNLTLNQSTRFKTNFYNQHKLVINWACLLLEKLGKNFEFLGPAYFSWNELFQIKHFFVC